jgi:hypothetical protein
VCHVAHLRIILLYVDVALRSVPHHVRNFGKMRRYFLYLEKEKVSVRA